MFDVAIQCIGRFTTQIIGTSGCVIRMACLKPVHSTSRATTPARESVVQSNRADITSIDFSGAAMKPKEVLPRASSSIERYCTVTVTEAVVRPYWFVA